MVDEKMNEVFMLPTQSEELEKLAKKNFEEMKKFLLDKFGNTGIENKVKNVKFKTVYQDGIRHSYKDGYVCINLWYIICQKKKLMVGYIVYRFRD